MKLGQVICKVTCTLKSSAISSAHNIASAIKSCSLAFWGKKLCAKFFSTKNSKDKFNKNTQICNDLQSLIILRIFNTI